MSKVKVGSIVSLKIKYPDNVISEDNHYYLIIEEIKGQKYIMLEIVQFDTLTDEKEQLRYEDYISNVNGEPNTCIYKNSYIDKRKGIRIEDFDELEKCLVKNPISVKAINSIIKDCKDYRENHKLKFTISLLKDDIIKFNDDVFNSNSNYDNTDTEDDTNDPPSAPPQYRK